MKSLGIVRRLDQLGRIVIPMEFRRIHGWDEKTPIEMFAENGCLMLRKYDGQRDQKAEIAETLMWAIDALNKKQVPKEEIREKLQELIHQIFDGE